MTNNIYIAVESPIRTLWQGLTSLFGPSKNRFSAWEIFVALTRSVQAVVFSILTGSLCQHAKIGVYTKEGFRIFHTAGGKVQKEKICPKKDRTFYWVKIPVQEDQQKIARIAQFLTYVHENNGKTDVLGIMLTPLRRYSETAIIGSIARSILSTLGRPQINVNPQELPAQTNLAFSCTELVTRALAYGDIRLSQKPFNGVYPHDFLRATNVSKITDWDTEFLLDQT